MVKEVYGLGQGFWRVVVTGLGEAEHVFIYERITFFGSQRGVACFFDAHDGSIFWQLARSFMGNVGMTVEIATQTNVRLSLPLNSALNAHRLWRGSGYR